MCTVSLMQTLAQLSKDSHFLIDTHNGVYVKEEFNIEPDNLMVPEEFVISDDEDTAEIPADHKSHNKKNNKTKRKGRNYKIDVISLMLLTCTKCNKSKKTKFRERAVTKCGKCRTSLTYICSICKKEFAKRRNLYEHIKYECIPEPLFKCSECNYRVRRRKYLRKHMLRLHTAINPENYHKCLKCGRDYKQINDLRKHLRLCGVTPNLRCQHCDYITNNPRNLRLHVQKRHTVLSPEELHTCSVCQKSFRFKPYLVSHLRLTHRLGDQISCDHCHYKTFLKAKLLNHILRNHHPDFLHK